MIGLPELLAGTIRMATPLLLAALGGVICERSGVVNIALEGIMLNGAFFTVAGTAATGSPWAGLLTGATAGLLTAGLHALVSVGAGADQIVSGVALNILAMGLTRLLCQMMFGSSSNSPMVAGFQVRPIPLLSEIPLLGPALFRHSWLVYGSWGLVGLVHVILWRTPAGLHLRAAGENPEAAEAAGIPVRLVRTVAVLASGVLGALGGAFLALDTHQFVRNMSAGRGYIALAAVIFGKWTPRGALFGCLLFGLADKLQMSLRVLPAELAEMVPYLVTVLVLAGWVGRARAPGALGQP